MYFFNASSFVNAMGEDASSFPEETNVTLMLEFVGNILHFVGE